MHRRKERCKAIIPEKIEKSIFTSRFGKDTRKLVRIENNSVKEREAFKTRKRKILTRDEEGYIKGRRKT